MHGEKPGTHQKGCLALPALFWSKQTINEVIKFCVILHRMMVEDRGGIVVEEEGDQGFDFININNMSKSM